MQSLWTINLPPIHQHGVLGSSGGHAAAGGSNLYFSPTPNTSFLPLDLQGREKVLAATHWSLHRSCVSYTRWPH